jgi:hypothetical protein
MEKVDILDSWQGKPCALATMHGKEVAIKDLVETGLGVSIVVPAGFDTDKFGTFTREIKRDGNQLEAARRKALAAIAETGFELAIASEGSFGAHPTLPFVSSNLELVLLVDTKNNIEVAGHYRSSNINPQGQEVTTAEEAALVAKKWGFPAQGIILRASKNSPRKIFKEIKSEDELIAVAKKLLGGFLVTSIYMEMDLRAHRCPARMQNIKAATEDLIKNCRSLCPECQTPGFVAVKTIPGLPCELCHLPTELPKEIVYSCQKCHHKESRPASGTKLVEAGQCQWCNP